MGSFVDILLLAIVVFFLFSGIRRGFVRTLLSFASRIASVVLAFFVSDKYDELIYEKFLKDSVVNSIEEHVSASSVNGEISSFLEETLAGPASVLVCRIIVFAIISVVASFVFDIIINLVCKIVQLPVLRTANKALGGVLGLLNGLVCVLIISYICVIAVGLVNNAEFSEVIASSRIIEIFTSTKNGFMGV